MRKKHESKIVSFDEDKEIYKQESTDEMEKETVGTYWMKVKNNECYNEEITSFVVEILVHQHKTPEVVTAKETEIKNLTDYDTYKEVTDVGQERIISILVITKKESHDRQKTKVKAWLIAHGFQEEKGSSVSDSPTVMKESHKLFTAIAENEGFLSTSKGYYKAGNTLEVEEAYIQSE